MPCKPSKVPLCVCGEQVKMQEASISRQQRVRGGSAKVPRLLHHGRHQQSGAFLNINIDGHQYSYILLIEHINEGFHTFEFGTHL